VTAARASVALVVVACVATGSSDAASPRRGGTLVIATQEQACLNTLLPACGAAGLFLTSPIDQVLEGAYEVRPGLTYRPNLVSRAHVTTNPFTVTYDIRANARWSDGVPITAADFVFTHEVFASWRALDARLQAVHSVSPLGPKRLRVIFKTPIPEWRQLFHNVLPRHVLVDAEPRTTWLDAIDNPRTGAPIGSGPFLVHTFERGRQLTLVRNPRYWGERKAYLDRLVFRFFRPSEYADALHSGAAGLIEPESTQGQAAAREIRLRPRPGERVLSAYGSSWEHLELRVGSNGHPALRQRGVRRALAYGIDRRALAQAVQGTGAKQLESAVFLGTNPSYAAIWKAYRYRPAEARRLLDRAGCRARADGIRSCDGRRLSLRFVTTPTESRALALRLLQVQLRRIGVEVVPVFASTSAFFQTVLPTGDFDAAMFSWKPRGLDAPSYVFGCGRINNYTGYCNRTLDRELARAAVTVEERRRTALLRRIDRALARDVPVIPLWQGRFLVAMRTNVHGVIPSDVPDEGFAWNAEAWWLDRDRSPSVGSR
jgi:peptide/nickel transport system substrate-binding protein